MSEEHIQEFDCTDCGRHIVLICGWPGTRKCGACVVTPGWFRDPTLRKAIDRDYDADYKEPQQ